MTCSWRLSTERRSHRWFHQHHLWRGLKTAAGLWSQWVWSLLQTDKIQRLRSETTGNRHCTLKTFSSHGKTWRRFLIVFPTGENTKDQTRKVSGWKNHFPHSALCYWQESRVEVTLVWSRLPATVRWRPAPLCQCYHREKINMLLSGFRQ